MLAAGAGAALVAFWIDAQVGLPVFITRLCFFVLLAVAITPAGERTEASGAPEDRLLARAVWVVACGAALLSFVPAFGAGRDDGLQAANLARALPVLALLILGRCLGSPGRYQGSTWAALKLTALLGVVAVLAVLRYHVALPATASDWLHTRSAVDAALPVLLWLCPFALAWVAWRAGGAQYGGRIAGFLLASALGVLATAWPTWRLMVASVAHAGFTLVERRETETRINLQRAAVSAAQRNPGMQQLADSLMRAMSPRLFAGRDDVIATAELVSHLGAVAEEHNVWLQNATTRPAEVGEAGVRTLHVALRAESDLEGLLRFLQALEHGDKLLRVDRLDISIAAGSFVADGVEPVSISASIMGYAIPEAPARAPGATP